MEHDHGSSRVLIMKQQGFILVVALIFLSLLAMLSLNALGNSQLQIHIANHISFVSESFRAIEAGLMEGESKFRTLSYKKLPDRYYMQPWENKEYSSIRYNQLDVHYIIDKLQGTNCIQDHNGQIGQGAFFRITAWLPAPQQRMLVLQTTYAYPIGLPCILNENAIQPGRLSWREFYI